MVTSGAVMPARSISRPLSVSVAVHAAVALAIVALGHRPPVGTPAAAVTSTIGAIDDALERPAPAVDVEVVGHPAGGGHRSVRAPRIRATARHDRRPLPPPEPALAINDVAVPPSPPAETTAPSVADTTGGDVTPSGAAGDGGGEGEGEGEGKGAYDGAELDGAGPLGHELHARVLGDEPVTVDARPGVAILSHDQATALRQRDSFPRLPESVWPGWRPYIVRLEVCVAEDGHVSNAVLRSAASPRLDAIVRAAVRTWRYQPWLVAGTATPFCHGVVIKYERW